MQEEAKGDILNFKRVDHLFIFGHCIFLLSQLGFTYAYGYTFEQGYSLKHIAKTEYWTNLTYRTERLDIYNGAVLDAILCCLVCRIVHDCQQLEKRKGSKLFDSSASEDSGPDASLESSTNWQDSNESANEQAVEIQISKKESMAYSEAEMCAAQWFMNEVDVQVTEEESEPDEFNRSEANHLMSALSLNYDDE